MFTPIRHYVLQALGLMWAVAFATATGCYTVFAVSVLGHTVLIAAAAITVTTWTAATVKPQLFTGGSQWRNGIISRADVAEFLVRQIGDGEYIRKTPVLIN